MTDPNKEHVGLNDNPIYLEWGAHVVSFAASGRPRLREGNHESL
jgi:hypothetical protein